MNKTSITPSVPMRDAQPRERLQREWRVTLVGERLAADKALRRLLGADYAVNAYSRAREAMASMDVDEGQADVVVVEQSLPDALGPEFLRELRIRHPNTIRLLTLDTTDSNVVQQAVNDAAVYQVVMTPWEPESLRLLVRRALESRELARIHRYLSRELKFADNVVTRENETMRNALQEVYSFDRMVFASTAMAEVCNLARKAAATDLPVLIEGETGTGKELMARAIHLFSQRNKMLFMPENCGAIHDDLLQSELFGHRKGAFTGATTDRLGLFQAADGGTVFLDEISEISPGMQVSLLRFLQEGEVRPLGSDQTRHTNVRIVAACNRPLRALVAEGKFRQDLYYRLRGFELRIPPLRERPDDIPPLVAHLLDKYSSQASRRIAGVTPDAMVRLCAHSYPGNVRELEIEVRRLVALADDGDFITVRHLPPEIAAAVPSLARTHASALVLPGKTLKDKVEALEESLVRSTLDRFSWNHSRAAIELGLSRVGLANKIKRYNVIRAGAPKNL
jgi:two-component system, NtrC family, response regulator HupR/HoxA